MMTPDTQAALLELYMQSAELDEPGLYLAAIEIAAKLTASAIGYFHLVNEDQETIELGAWTAATLSHCRASYDRHYPISEAGVWADSARNRSACIHNDYQSLSGTRGYPDGHAHLTRHLGVPVVDAGKVVLLVGVGNKASDYDDADQATLQLVADQAWALIRRQRQHAALLIADKQLGELQELGDICVWHWDPEERALRCNANAAKIFAVDSNQHFDCTLEKLLAFIDVRDHSVMLDLLRNPVPDTSFNLYLRGFRANGAAILLNFRGSTYPRTQGHGLVVRGLLQDATARREIGTAGYHATHDGLTGLANQAFLVAQLKTRLHNSSGKAADSFAVMLINLDHFRQINDRFGHTTGDEVLKVVASRLLGSVDHDELVARIGGDEIVVVQRRFTAPDVLEAHAKSIIETIQRPIEIGGHRIELSASVGIALASPGGETSKDVLARAEQAMRHAKESGRGIHRIA